MPCFGRIIMRFHDLVVFFAMQVARSLRIRSRYLAMPAGKARRTQAQLHAATRGSVRFHADMSLQPERRMYAYPHFSDAQSPKQMTAVSTACRPHRQSPNAEERSTLLTTLLGMHTMARRHCEAARRQQARVTAGGPSSHARRGRTTPHRYDMRQRAVPPGTGRCQKGAALAVFIPLPKLAVCRHTQYSMQKCEDVCIRIRTHVWCVKKKCLSIGPCYSLRETAVFKIC
jgi:hypothetical protein